MKSCKSFFDKSLIIRSAADLKLSLETKNACRLYGFCLLKCLNNDFRAQRIMRFSDSYDAALLWLQNNDIDGNDDLYGVVLGCDL